MSTRITAVFPQLGKAQDAATELRRAGLLDTHLSVVVKKAVPFRKPPGKGGTTGPLLVVLKPTTPAEEKLCGMASVSIPGAGPFLAAGALAESLSSTGGLVPPSAVGSVPVGVLASALAQAGWSGPDASFYASELEAGKVLMAVEMDEDSTLSPSNARNLMTRHAGKLATAAI